MAKQYNADLFVKNGGLSTEVLMADGGVSPSSDFVNETSTFLPINTDGDFTDSPFYTLPPDVNFVGFGGIGTKSYMNFVEPEGGVPNYDDFGLEIKSYSAATMNSSVSIGDYAQYIGGGSGEFYWYTGASLTYDPSGNPFSFLPMESSGIIHNSMGYNLLNITNGFFKIDAKTGNPSRVDGLLFNIDAGGLGFGRGLDINSGSYEESIYWNLMTGDFNIKGVYGSNVLFSNPSLAQTYIMDGPSKMGIEMEAMYISDDLTVTASVSGSHSKVLNVRDESGNSYGIKLHPYS